MILDAKNLTTDLCLNQFPESDYWTCEGIILSLLAQIALLSTLSKYDLLPCTTYFTLQHLFACYILVAKLMSFGEKNPAIFLVKSKIVHTKYYKHFKKSAHQSHLGRQKMGWFLADQPYCTSSKTEIRTEILNRKGIQILILNFQVNLDGFFHQKK